MIEIRERVREIFKPQQTLEEKVERYRVNEIYAEFFKTPTDEWWDVELFIAGEEDPIAKIHGVSDIGFNIDKNYRLSGVTTIGMATVDLIFQHYVDVLVRRRKDYVEIEVL